MSEMLRYSRVVMKLETANTLRNNRRYDKDKLAQCTSDSTNLYTEQGPFLFELRGLNRLGFRLHTEVDVLIVRDTRF